MTLEHVLNSVGAGIPVPHIFLELSRPKCPAAGLLLAYVHLHITVAASCNNAVEMFVTYFSQSECKINSNVSGIFKTYYTETFPAIDGC